MKATDPNYLSLASRLEETERLWKQALEELTQKRCGFNSPVCGFNSPAGYPPAKSILRQLLRR